VAGGRPCRRSFASAGVYRRGPNPRRSATAFWNLLNDRDAAGDELFAAIVQAAAAFVIEWHVWDVRARILPPDPSH